MPPVSSKKRSAISVCWVGTSPSMALPAARYSAICPAASGASPTSPVSHAMAAAPP